MKRVKIGLKTAETLSWMLLRSYGSKGGSKNQRAIDSLDRAIAKVERENKQCGKCCS